MSNGIMRTILFVTLFGLALGHFRTLEKARLSTLSCKSNCLENFTPLGLQGEFNCFQHSYCWTCWFGCKLFHQNLAAWSVLCSPKSHEICLEGCQISCRFHQNDNELDEAAHPEGPLTTQEAVEDVKYEYDPEYNTTNIEWDYKPNAEVNGIILVVGSNESLSDTESVKPHELYIIGRTYYRNITIDDRILDEFCTIRLATVDSSKKISLLNIHTEHLKRHTNKCHSTGVHHHPPIISSIHVTDLRRRYNLSMPESLKSTTTEPSPSIELATATTSAAVNGVASPQGNPSSSSALPVMPSSAEPNSANMTSPQGRVSTAQPLELFAAPTLVALSSPPTSGPLVHHSAEDPRPEVLKAEIRWEPFVNSSEDASCIKYKVTWKSALIDKVAGDLLTCSTNTSISVERNSVYHVWVSLFGHEQIRTQQLTVETAHAQYAKLRAMEICHGCVRGDYTTGVSAALASVIVLAVAVFLLIKSYRSYTLKDHNLRNSGSSYLMPSALLGELGAKPSMQVIEPKMLTSNTSSRASAHVTITPIAVHGPEGAPSSSRNGPYEPLSLEDEDANYFVFDLPKNYAAV